MSVTIQSTSGAQQTPPWETAPSVQSKSAFDSAAFMQMMMAQLTHQNPMEPMKDVEMMSQMAQLNSLQELQSIKANMLELNLVSQAGYAAAMIGKHVKAEINGETIEGKVTAITVEGNQMMVHMGDKSAPLAAVIEIGQAEA